MLKGVFMTDVMNNRVDFGEVALNTGMPLNPSERITGATSKLFGMATGRFRTDEPLENTGTVLTIEPMESINSTGFVPPRLQLTETKKMSISDRSYSAYGRLLLMATPNFLLASEENSNDTKSKEENDKKQKKRVGGAALIAAGTTLVGILIATKGFSDFSPHFEVANHVGNAHHAHSVGHNHSGPAAPKAAHNHSPKHGKEKPSNRGTKVSSYLKAKLPKGSNMWLQSKKELGKKASLEAIAKRDDLLLKLNHLTFSSARHLKVGYRFLYPR
jgi:hypothetical protein